MVLKIEFQPTLAAPSTLCGIRVAFVYVNHWRWHRCGQVARGVGGEGGGVCCGHPIGLCHDIRAAGTAVLVVTNTRPKSYKSPPAVRAESAQVVE